MVTLGQRITELRTEKGYSYVKLATELGYPKGAIEKFETGRQTPSKEQQEQMSNFFGVSLLYIRGETNDKTRQSNWMDELPNAPDEVEAQKSVSIRKKPQAAPEKKKKEAPPEGALLDGLLATPAVRQLLKEVVLETLKSPEGQAAIRRAMK